MVKSERILVNLIVGKEEVVFSFSTAMSREVGDKIFE